VIDEGSVEGWIERYEDAWRSPGTSALAALFTDDATYQTAPFNEPHRGLPEIREMWDEERDGPDEPFTMTSEVIAVTDPRAVARVEVRYDPPDGQLYRDLWVMEFAPDGRCLSFEEWPFWPPGSDGAPAG
jgi:ketosteroid isomerase-like protein